MITLVGPTAILSLLTGALIRRDVGDAGEWATLLCFFAGCSQLAMGVLRLGTHRKAVTQMSGTYVNTATMTLVVNLVTGYFILQDSLLISYLHRL